MEWDAENGVWKGDLAPVMDEVPDPLYIFGNTCMLFSLEGKIHHASN